MSANLGSNFFNVIICEDIREEVGNKKSLMGVFAGDIFVAELPALLQLAVFMQYQPASDDTISIQLRLMQGEVEIAKASLSSKPAADTDPVVIALPRAMVAFENETSFRIMGSVNGGPETEIVTKRILKGSTS